MPAELDAMQELRQRYGQPINNPKLDLVVAAGAMVELKELDERRAKEAQDAEQPARAKLPETVSTKDLAAAGQPGQRQNG